MDFIEYFDALYDRQDWRNSDWGTLNTWFTTLSYDQTTALNFIEYFDELYQCNNESNWYCLESTVSRFYADRQPYHSFPEYFAEWQKRTKQSTDGWNVLDTWFGIYLRDPNATGSFLDYFDDAYKTREIC